MPAYASSTATEALEFLRMIGFSLDPWQEFVLSESLGERPDGNWSAFEVALVVARQNGKSELLAARQLVGLFVLHEPLIIHTAQQFDTAKEVFRRVEDVIENEPMLKRRVDLNRGRVGKWANGQEGIELRDGCRLRYRARGTGGGGRGFTADCLMFDEAMILAESVVGSVLPLLSSVPFPQVWYAGSAVDQEIHEHGIVLSRLRSRAIAGDDPSLAYFEWSAPGDSPDDLRDADLDSCEYRALANPAYELRISEEYITRERRAMPRRSFAVERLGVGDWPDPSQDAERVITAEAWEAIAEHDRSNRIEGVPAFAIDANPDQTHWSIGVAGRRADGLLQFAVVTHEADTGALVERCREIKRAYPGSKFVVDKGGPIAEKIDDLKLAHIRLRELSTEEYAQACGGFLSAVVESRARYPAPQPDLDDALAAARKQKLGDRWKWARRDSATGDLTPLVACSLALWAAENLRRARVINPNSLLGGPR